VGGTQGIACCRLPGRGRRERVRARARQIHGNVCMRAVVVTPQLDWRLHAFDLLCEAGGPPLGSSEPWPLAAGAWAVGAQYKAAEARLG